MKRQFFILFVMIVSMISFVQVTASSGKYESQPVKLVRLQSKLGSLDTDGKFIPCAQALRDEKFKIQPEGVKALTSQIAKSLDSIKQDSHAKSILEHLPYVTTEYAASILLERCNQYKLLLNIKESKDNRSLLGCKKRYFAMALPVACVAVYFLPCKKELLVGEGLAGALMIAGNHLAATIKERGIEERIAELRGHLDTQIATFAENIGRIEAQAKANLENAYNRHFLDDTIVSRLKPVDDRMQLIGQGLDDLANRIEIADQESKKRDETTHNLIRGLADLIKKGNSHTTAEVDRALEALQKKQQEQMTTLLAAVTLGKSFSLQGFQSSRPKITFDLGSLGSSSSKMLISSNRQ